MNLNVSISACQCQFCFEKWTVNHVIDCWLNSQAKVCFMALWFCWFISCQLNETLKIFQNFNSNRFKTKTKTNKNIEKICEKNVLFFSSNIVHCILHTLFKIDSCRMAEKRKNTFCIWFTLLQNTRPVKQLLKMNDASTSFLSSKIFHLPSEQPHSH